MPMLGRPEQTEAGIAGRDAASAALDRLLVHVMTTVQADRSLLLLCDEGRPGTTVAAAGAGYEPSPIGRRFATDRGLSGEVLRTGKPVIVADYAELDRRIEFGCSRRPYAAMAAPVITEGEIVGVIAAVGCTPGWRPGAEQCEVLSSGAELLGRALPALGARTPVGRRVAELHAELAAHDDDTGIHCDEVGDLARAVAPAVGLNEDEVDELDLAAQLHDLGKTGVPLSILRKRGPLTPKEWALVHEHPGRGARMLAELPGLAPVGWVVRHHHERWDGTGYPDRIGSEQIPLGSRIIGACDAFLAMVRDRPYRAAMDRREAVQELHRGAGEQFDPRVVDALVATVG
jgi:HD-GYP domain-containing protein (c-di-GMP phosphodiesterase class II)